MEIPRTGVPEALANRLSMAEQGFCRAFRVGRGRS